MSGLLDALYTGRTIIEAARAGVQLTSHNISNVNTEGFHRRRLLTSPIDPPPVLGGGVRVDGSSRAIDELLARRVGLALGQDGWASSRQALLVQVERSAADLGEGGLGSVISTLMTKLSALATAPNDPAVRGEVLAASRSLTDAFNRVSSDLQAVADGADRSMSSVVAEVNQKTALIAKLNAQIAQAEGTGGEASDLRDQRDLLVSQLAGIAGASSFVDGAGNVSVIIGGMSLVQGDHAATLEATPDVALGGHSRIDYVDGSTRADLTSRIDSGKLGGLLSVRDSVVPSILGQLDQLAYDLASAINTQHRTGYGLDGVNNRDLFQPLAGVSGAAAALSLRTGLTAGELAASSTAAGVPGNGENALALAGLGRSLLAGGGTATFGGQAAAIAGQVGSTTSQALQAATLSKDSLTHLQSLQQSSDGVSLDEEMVQLVQYQRAYQAGAKVLQVIDDLLGSLMSI